MRFGRENRLGTIVWDKGTPRASTPSPYADPSCARQAQAVLSSAGAEQAQRRGHARQGQDPLNGKVMLPPDRQDREPISPPGWLLQPRRARTWGPSTRPSPLAQGPDAVQGRRAPTARSMRPAGSTKPSAWRGNKKRAPDAIIPLTPSDWRSVPCSRAGWRIRPERWLLDEDRIVFGADHTMARTSPSTRCEPRAYASSMTPPQMIDAWPARRALRPPQAAGAANRPVVHPGPAISSRLLPALVARCWPKPGAKCRPSILLIHRADLRRALCRSA